jgi:membrane-associated phospholipid phosphatase
MARMLARLGMAQADAFICCWDCKYSYWSIRPVTAIRASIDSTWLPPIVTPPFPSYPSGHSTTSGAASTVLGYIFPDSAEVLRQMGTQAMSSRLFGGIHFGSDNITGLNMGNVIGTRVVLLANRDGSPKPSVRWRGWTAARISRPTAMPVPARGRLTDMAD